MAHFTVIGLGRFGIAASLELIHLGHTVTGVDSDPKMVEKYVESLTEAVICDCSDETALRELDLASSEVVLVAIGEDMQSSLLCTLALKNLGVKVIWVKASTKAHHTIVSKLGVARIIHPEEEMGIRVAQSLNYPMVSNFLPIGDGMYVVEIHIKAHLDKTVLSKLLGSALDDKDAALTNVERNPKGKVAAIMVKRDLTVISKLDSSFVLQTNDALLLCGSRTELQYLAPRLV
ncbi:TrkA family potassium uptake protein [Shewanella baltica]|jgi:trk system potassium uptake protein TrkA|uniref:potassium channel family protein n=1 Tax=Shewanella TaxID=22 RepID=UPI0009032555|nr:MULTISPECIES: TrkA family potassium uptake protein [Shewanella]MCS6237214.1 TrkA family potassium uptake protein [Shewanella baltica]MCS6271732.1 TrkA family potassium uptake protein [Shewanella baltica]OUS50200.1 potassium transporter TrkA [Shewanella sp. SACH]